MIVVCEQGRQDLDIVDRLAAAHMIADDQAARQVVVLTILRRPIAIASTASSSSAVALRSTRQISCSSGCVQRTKAAPNRSG